MRALDAIWVEEEDQSNSLAKLREHAIRLCLASNEVAQKSGEVGWAALENNLHMAASLIDIDADTDLRQTSFMCRPASDYEDLLSEITRKHLAGVVVFNLCWTAYEVAVELANAPEKSRQPKGALGRDLLIGLEYNFRIPFLRDCLERSMQFVDCADAEFVYLRRLYCEGHFAGAAAELMRCFRNQVVHGKVKQPDLFYLRDDADQDVDNDPLIVRFRHQIRLVLLITQCLALMAVDPTEEISDWSESDAEDRSSYGGELRPATDVLASLHFNFSPLPLFEWS